SALIFARYSCSPNSTRPRPEPPETCNSILPVAPHFGHLSSGVGKHLVILFHSSHSFPQLSILCAYSYVGIATYFLFFALSTLSLLISVFLTFLLFQHQYLASR